MKTIPNISILIACYNKSKYIYSCLDSILEQTYRNFEILIVNDGSTDNSLEILEHYQKIDNRIRIINQTNHGIGYVRNVLVNNAVGNYICFVDIDDFLPKDAIENLWTNSENGKYDIVAGKANVVFNNKYKLPFIAQPKFNDAVGTNEYVKYNICVPWGSIIRRSLFENGPGFLSGYVYEDLIMNYYFLFAKKLKAIKNVVYFYCRYDTTSHISVFTYAKRWDINSVYTQINHLLKASEKVGFLNDKEKKEALRAVIIQPLMVVFFLIKYYSNNSKINSLVWNYIYHLLVTYDIRIKVNRTHWKFLSAILINDRLRASKKNYTKNLPLKIKRKKVYVTDTNIKSLKEKTLKNASVYINTNNEFMLYNFIQKYKDVVSYIFIHNEILTKQKRLSLLARISESKVIMGIYYDDTSFDFESDTLNVHCFDYSLVTKEMELEKIALYPKRILRILNRSQYENYKKHSKQFWNVLIN